MKMLKFGLVIAALVSSVSTAMVIASRAAEDDRNVSPIFGVTIPEDYRQWTLIAPALERLPDRQPGCRQTAATTEGRTSMVVSILFCHRARPRRIRREPEGLCAAHLATGVTAMEV